MKPNKIGKRSFIMAMALAAVFALAAAQPCTAQTTWIVISTADSGSGTLREALANAADGDTINFNLTLQATIALTSGALVVDKSVTITGPGQDLLTVDGGNNSRVFEVLDKTVTISGLTIANGRDPYGSGGGIFTVGALTLRNCTLRDNSAGSSEDLFFGGGAILCYAGPLAGSNPTLTIGSSLLINNRAKDGGGISIYVQGSAEYPRHASVTVINSTLSGNTGLNSGGGIHVKVGGDDPEFSSATVTVENSTLSDNSSTIFGGAILNFASGGGTTLALKNTTLSGNFAADSGAIFNMTESGGSAMVTVDNCTLSGNDDTSGISGIANWGDSGATVNIKNTILANNPSGANLVNEGGVIVSSGYNLSTDNGGGFLTATGDQINVTDPKLGPLADNGGPTLTHALLPGSPAIDAADSTDSGGNSVTTDQRGFARPHGSANDIGALEAGATMGYQFIGFTAPVDNPNVMNIAKAGQTIPLKWRLLYSNGAPVTDLASVSVTVVSLTCSAGTTTDAIEEYAAGASGLQNLGDGYYQWNWKTPATYANSCKTLKLDLGEGAGNEHTALFKFKK